jgi:hypothetical protein
MTRREDEMTRDYEAACEHHRAIQEDIGQRHRVITERRPKDELLDLAHEQIMFDFRKIEQLTMNKVLQPRKSSQTRSI